MIQVFLLVFISESCNTISQILFKKSANSLSAHPFNTLESYGQFLKHIFHIRNIWIGFSLMAFALVAWLMALTGADLSFVYPVGSLQYVLVLVFSRIMLNEKIDRMKFFGTMLVIAGIIVIGFSR